MPLISVIIPLYNKEAIIGRSIQSVLSQSFKDFELIIVNDGSTDGSAKMVKTFCDDRILFIEQENGGPSKARNTGIRHAQGDWIVFLDADDELLPDALSNFWSSHLRHKDADIIDYGTILKSGERTKKRLHKEEGYIKNNFKSWFYGELMPGSGHSMFHTSLFKENLYDERLRRYEDAELLFRMLKKAVVYMETLPAFIVNTEFSMASNARENISEDFAGHLSLKGLLFWERMCMYKFFIEERKNYPNVMKSLYPNFFRRYDLNMMFHLLKKTKR